MGVEIRELAHRSECQDCIVREGSTQQKRMVLELKNKYKFERGHSVRELV